MYIRKKDFYVSNSGSFVRTFCSRNLQVFSFLTEVCLGVYKRGSRGAAHVAYITAMECKVIKVLVF